MTAVTISPKFQVVIPRKVREKLGLSPGEKVQILEYDSRIEFIPLRSMRKLRGLVKGIDTIIPREGDRA